MNMGARYSSDLFYDAAMDYIRTKFKPAFVEKHFVQRLFQRFDAADRAAIIAKLEYVLKSENCKEMIKPLRTGGRVLFGDGLVLGITLNQKGRVVVKTVFKRV